MMVRTMVAGLVLGLAALGAAVLQAADPVPGAVSVAPPAAAFTDSSAALLAGTRRVAISSVVIAFQASTGEQKGGGGIKVPIFGGPRVSVQNVLAMPRLDAALQDAIAEAAYRNLSAQMTKAGYEVVPEAQVKASPSYAAIIKQAGYANHSQFANALGDVMLVGPPGLQPYTASQMEIGEFQFPKTAYMSWIGGFGAGSKTPGGPSVKMQADAWKVPGLEVALAKELNAHVVKAYYVVSLGQTSVQKKVELKQVTGKVIDAYAGEYQTTRMVRDVSGSSSSFAQAGLIADQTHLAFRSPNGNAKWQKVSMMKIVPPKDGDVVVRITEPVFGGTEWFSLQEAEWQRAGGFFSAQKRGDINGLVVVDLTNPVGYGQDVVQMMVLANRAMLGLIPAS